MEYSWPGNVRELQNCLERAVILADGNVVQEKDILTQSGAPSGSIADYLDLEGPLSEVRKRAADEAEKQAILKAWQNSAQNLDNAAMELGISVKTLASKLKDWKAHPVVTEAIEFTEITNNF